MIKKLKRLKQAYKNARNYFIHHDATPYNHIVEKINAISLRNASDSHLKGMSQELMGLARQGTEEMQILVHAFALVKEASRRVLLKKGTGWMACRHLLKPRKEWFLSPEEG